MDEGERDCGVVDEVELNAHEFLLLVEVVATRHALPVCPSALKPEKRTLWMQTCPDGQICTMFSRLNS